MRKLRIAMVSAALWSGAALAGPWESVKLSLADLVYTEKAKVVGTSAGGSGDYGWHLVQSDSGFYRCSVNKPTECERLKNPETK